MKTLRGLLVIIAAFYLQSCQNPECLGTGLGRLTFAGFDSVGLERVIVKRYNVNNDFDHPTDSVVYHLSDGPGPLKYDQNGGVVWPYYSEIYEGEDIEIDIPGAARTYRITNITSTHSRNIGRNAGGSSTGTCYNVLESYKLDGMTVITGKPMEYGVAIAVEVSIPR